jgi:hypothetical protein
MNMNELDRWADGLRKTARRGLSHAQFAPREGDRTSWTPFLRWKGLLADHPPAVPDTPDPDARLWWALNNKASSLDPRDVSRRTDGPLFEQGLFGAIEVWTESELSALQALWWIGRRQRAVLDRLRTAALWHIQNTQPDNATNRPWAIPVFLEIAIADSSPDARLYAETLLHNAIAANGIVEPFSATILLDAADAVEVMRSGD